MNRVEKVSLAVIILAAAESDISVLSVLYRAIILIIFTSIFIWSNND